ncbi:MAG: sigma-54 interaction domain-containing protein [Thermacetogeniaceae bacterium]
MQKRVAGCCGADEKAKRLAMLESAIEAVSEGILITDVEGKIIYYNSSLGRMEGLRPEEVIGRYLTEVYRVTPETSEHLTVVKTGRPFKELAKVHFTAEGREISLVSSTYPIYLGDEVIGAFSVCRDITKLKDLLSENISLQKQMQGEESQTGYKNGTRYTLANFVYASQAMEEVVQQAKKAAKTDCAVLVYGETGTGKEVIIQGIHNASARCSEPFVGINCAAIPETLLESLLFGTVKGAFTGAVDSTGLIEQAGSGTLFLDEINSMSTSLQAKLLRVLQERTFRRVGGKKEIPVECRIVSSTNLDPWECVKNGTLREDLYYRFAVFTIYIPPLRERPEDIEALIEYFIQKYGKIYGQGRVRVDPGLKEAFMSYRWPGNVRELEHIIESCLAMLEPGEDTITFEHLPPHVRPRFAARKAAYRPKGGSSGTLQQLMLEYEKQVIEEAMERNGGNISRAARELGILRQNLQYRMRKLGIRGARDEHLCAKN